MRVIDLLENGMARAQQRPCVIDEHVAYTHAQVRELSHRIANGLHAAGLRRGARVAVYSPNVALTLVAMIGLLRAGAVWLPVQTRNPLAENIAFLAENNCEFVFFHSSVAADAEAMRAAVPSLKGMVCFDQSSSDAPAFAGWAAGFGADFPDDLHGPEDLAWIKGTGGTTGRPKSVMICHRNAEALFANFNLCMPLPGPHINLAAVPVTHGAGNIAMCVLFSGGTTVLLDRADPLRILEAIEQHRITTMFLPPTVIYNLLATPAVRERDFSSLRYFIYAAAPMSAQKLAEAIDTFGPVMAQAWGQTEAPLICTYMSPADHDVADPERRMQRLKSCGRPSPLTRVEVMDDDGNLLPPNQRGELVVRGNLVMKGYYNRPEENEAATRFGWHHTGDIGYRDDEGYFYIVDRKKDMIISGGFNIYPSEIEQILWRHPSILDCAVVGVPDEKWGESVKAVVELKPGLSATEAELKDYCRASLGGMKAPKSIEFWASLPRSSVGKVLKREIRERYWAGQERRV
jgi:acyl-CoA synthetase (AMP-forming)/AMP-acid ligase II